MRDDAPQWDVVVLGAGAAGSIAAITAAERGRRTLLLEKNPRPGVKILMSGGTRCNLTHACDSRGIVEAYGDQGRFLQSALAVLSPQDLVAMFEAEGVAFKTEDTGKIFPVSDKASDIVDALMRRLHRSGATLALSSPALDIRRHESNGWIVATPGGSHHAQSVIVTTGGLSYPGCGTSGDGYPWAVAAGHTLTPTRPALTPIVVADEWVKGLSGLTIPDVLIRVSHSPEVVPPKLAFRRTKGLKKGLIDERRASFLFTHFGLSGPAPLDVSRALASVDNPLTLDVVCDFLPNVSSEAFETTLSGDLAREGRKQALTILSQHVPRRLAEALFTRQNLPPELRAAETSKTVCRDLVAAVKRCPMRSTGTLGYKKAEVTAGGVSLSEVDSRTMQSKLATGLFFAGEILDVDGPIGGYNFQAAFATGKLAGLHA